MRVRTISMRRARVEVSLFLTITCVPILFLSDAAPPTPDWPDWRKREFCRHTVKREVGIGRDRGRNGIGVRNLTRSCIANSASVTATRNIKLVVISYTRSSSD
jgi:hypothetical protein